MEKLFSLFCFLHGLYLSKKYYHKIYIYGYVEQTTTQYHICALGQTLIV